MYQLDPVGRLAPSGLDVSRAAATRHHHLAALDLAASSSSSTHAPATGARRALVVVGRLQALARATRGAHSTEVPW